MMCKFGGWWVRGRVEPTEADREREVVLTYACLDYDTRRCSGYDSDYIKCINVVRSTS